MSGEGMSSRRTSASSLAAPRKASMRPHNHWHRHLSGGDRVRSPHAHWTLPRRQRRRRRADIGFVASVASLRVRLLQRRSGLRVARFGYGRPVRSRSLRRSDDVRRSAILGRPSGFGTLTPPSGAPGRDGCRRLGRGVTAVVGYGRTARVARVYCIVQYRPTQMPLTRLDLALSDHLVLSSRPDRVQYRAMREYRCGRSCPYVTRGRGS